MFHGQESAKKIQLFLGPFKDFNGGCARFAEQDGREAFRN
jgi:hypothetical protein